MTTLLQFIRQHTCARNYGTRVPDRGVLPAKNKEQLLRDMNNENRSRKFRRFKKSQLDSHLKSECTLYAYGSGSLASTHTMCMLDTDVHKTGDENSSLLASKWIESEFPGICSERSTNLRGMHSFLLVDKQGHAAEDVNFALKRLEKWTVHNSKRYDVDKIEVKGHCNVFTWEHGRVVDVRFGTLMKVPRTFTVEQLANTFTITYDELMSERFDVPEPVEKEVEGSCSGRLVDVEKIDEWRDMVDSFLQGEVLTIGKCSLPDEAVSAILAALEFIDEHANDDESLPLERVSSLVNAMNERGDVRCNCSMTKVSRVIRACEERGWVTNLDVKYGPGKAKRRRVRMAEIRGACQDSLPRLSASPDRPQARGNEVVLAGPLISNLDLTILKEPVSELSTLGEISPVSQHIYLRVELPPEKVMREVRKFASEVDQKDDEPYLASLASLALQVLETRESSSSFCLSDFRMQNFLTDVVLKFYKDNKWIRILNRGYWDMLKCNYWTTEIPYSPITKPTIASLLRRKVNHNTGESDFKLEPTLLKLIASALPPDPYSVEGIAARMREDHRKKLLQQGVSDEPVQTSPTASNLYPGRPLDAGLRGPTSPDGPPRCRETLPTLATVDQPQYPHRHDGPSPRSQR